MKSNPASSRRRFVKLVALGTASSVFLGKPWRGAFVAEAQPFPGPGPGILRVKVSDYPALAAEFGSVRLGLNPISGANPDGLFYPVVITRGAGPQFYVLDSLCPHAGCVVSIYDEGEGVMRCPCHGSTYAVDGSKVSGPTTSPLAPLSYTFDGLDTLAISIPGLAYRVTVARAPGAATPRLQLDFPTSPSVQYEARFREKVSDEWTVVPFALLENAPTEHNTLLGDGLPARIFVDRTTSTGFFSVAVLLLDLT